MSSDYYENIQAVLNSQQELTELLQGLRGRFSKEFKNDARTIMIDEDGTKHPVYEIILAKLEKIKGQKSFIPPEAIPILSMMLGVGSRFSEWYHKQPTEYIDKISAIQHDIIVPVTERKIIYDQPWQVAVYKYQSVHHQYYIALKKVGLYLERLQQSTNISARDKELLSMYATDFAALADQLAKLGLDELNTTTVEAFCRGFSELCRSERFGNYMKASRDLAEKINPEVLPQIQSILRRNEGFHWHMGLYREVETQILPTEKELTDDFIACLQCLSRMRTPLHELSVDMDRMVPAAWSEAKKHIGFNLNVLQGQDLVQDQIKTKGDGFNLLDFILSFDSEYPCPSWGKIAGRNAAVRAGMIEEVLLLAFPEECQRPLGQAFSIRHIEPLYLGQSASFGRINPQELIGSELLDKSKKGILFSILAAIAPIQDKTIGSHHYIFTPTQKLKAYLQLIQAIDANRLRISDESPLEQKRKLAERVLYLMVKYSIPADNPDFQEINRRIQSKSGVKAMKALSRHLGYKEDVDLTKEKTIQKLFREWTAGTRILLQDLRARINHPVDYTAPPRPETPLGGAGAPGSGPSGADGSKGPSPKVGFFREKDPEEEHDPTEKPKKTPDAS